MDYPEAYHHACSHLVSFGAHGGNTKRGRHLIASALVALRHSHGRQYARDERRHMMFISGMFPVKPGNNKCLGCAHHGFGCPVNYTDLRHDCYEIDREE